MPTVKELKAELDELGIIYLDDARKADLEELIDSVYVEEMPFKGAVNSVDDATNMAIDSYEASEIIDPNAHPDTQAK